MQAEAATYPALTRGASANRITGTVFIAGAAVATIFNVLFPRADDPEDTVAVLTMMVENETLQQVCFLGVCIGIWLVSAGLVGIFRSLAGGPTAFLARLGLYGALLGAALFTASAGLGLAATGAAVDWADAGATTTSVEYAVAAALNAADDSVWHMSIVTFWGALGVLGIAMLKGAIHPRWMGVALIVLGFANATLVGLPLAVGVESQELILAFAGLGQLTLIWALAAGIWTLRNARD